MRALDLERCTWFPLLGFAELEPVAQQDRGCELYAFGRTLTGAEVFWCFDPSRPPGEMERVTILHGAR